MFQLSVNPLCIGKDKNTIGLSVWEGRTLTVQDLADWMYIQGRAFATGIYQDKRKHDASWVGAQSVVVDIDTFTPSQIEAIQDVGGIMPYLLSVDFVSRYAALIAPSSSYTTDTPKVHVIFLLDRITETQTNYQLLHDYISAQIPLTTDPALKRPSQGVFGTVYADDRPKSITDVYVNPLADRINVTQLSAEIVRLHRELLPYNDKALETAAASHVKPTIRSERHYEQPHSTQVRLVLEALGYALRGWGRKDYTQEWLPLVFAAYDGSDGDPTVRDYILHHPDIVWGGAKAKREFVNWWRKHTPREDGRRVRVASLFYMATRNGWLATSSIDLTQYDYETEHIEDVGQWLIDNDPERLLLMSATGTGKTRGAGLYLKHRMDNGTFTGKAVFFAPSIKLCVDLSATLKAIGVENTLYIDGSQTKDADTLSQAKVLVTTLQTFAIKVMRKGVKIEDYQLAVIDESDELISGFARAGLNKAFGFRSHVRAKQSQWGMTALYSIMQSVDRVFLLDGTATRVSLTALERFSPPGMVRCVKNTWSWKKAAVKMVPDVHSARHVATEAALDGFRVVVATDTRREARILYEYMLAHECVKPNDIILITGDTHHNEQVQAFFDDVNASAEKYRVVIYNSAMGSGVSITSVKPDVIVQIGTFVSARKMLQILNRYRQQATVYAYIMPNESLYTEDIDAKVSAINNVIRYEETVTIARRERTEIANVTLELARLSVQDELEQRRNRLIFYRHLLEGDNRKVTILEDRLADERYKDSYSDVYEALKDRKAEIYATWHTVDPLQRTDNKTGMHEDDIARGYLHTWIKRIVPDVDAALAQYDPTTLAEMVTKHGRYLNDMKRWLEPKAALERSLKDMLESRRMTLTFKLWLSKLELVSLVSMLFDNTDGTLYDDEAADKYTAFLNALKLREDMYNAYVRSSRKKYDTIINKKGYTPEAALTMCKYILNGIGLTVKRKQRRRGDERQQVYYIETGGMIELLNLGGIATSCITFDGEALEAAKKDVQTATAAYHRLAPAQKAQVLGEIELGSTFEEGVKIISAGV